MRVALLFLCLLGAPLLQAQTPRIDSLRRALYTSADPGSRLKVLARIYDEYQSLDADSLWRYAELGLRLSRTAGSALDYERANAARIESYLRDDNTDSALSLVETALVRNPVTDPARRAIWYRLAAQKVDCFGDASQYKEALAVLYAIIRNAEQYRDSAVLVRHMNTIGVINYNLDHLAEAFRWQFKALGWAGSHQRFTKEVAACYINLAEAYWWVGKNDSATWYIDRAIRQCNAIQNLFYLCNAYRVKSSIEQELKRYASAESYMLQAVALRSKLDGGLRRSNEAAALAVLYRRQGKHEASIRLLLDGLAQPQRPALHGPGMPRGVDVLRVSYLHSLASGYEAAGRYKDEVAALKAYIRARDTLYEINSARSIAELDAKYELQKKETTIARQKLDLVRQNYLLYGGILIAVILISTAAFMFINYRRQQSYRMIQLVAAEKLASRQAVLEAREAERSRISADLHDNLGAYAASIASNIDQLDPESPALDELRLNARAMVAQLADTIWVLKKDALSLTAISDRLKVFLQRIQPSYPGVQLDVEEDISEDVLLPAVQAFQLFRILQEGITNALRHSGATRICIRFTANESWALEIVDNGRGMPATLRAGNGLESMRNRAAESGWDIRWEQVSGGGTQVGIAPAGGRSIS